MQTKFTLCHISYRQRTPATIQITVWCPALTFNPLFFFFFLQLSIIRLLYIKYNENTISSIYLTNIKPLFGIVYFSLWEKSEHQHIVTTCRAAPLSLYCIVLKHWSSYRETRAHMHTQSHTGRQRWGAVLASGTYLLWSHASTPLTQPPTRRDSSNASWVQSLPASCTPQAGCSATELGSPWHPLSYKNGNRYWNLSCYIVAQWTQSILNILSLNILYYSQYLQ